MRSRTPDPDVILLQPSLKRNQLDREVIFSINIHHDVGTTLRAGPTMYHAVETNPRAGPLAHRLMQSMQSANFVTLVFCLHFFVILALSGDV